MLDNHPLNLGVVGSYSRWCANKIVSEADLAIFIGTRAGDMVTDEWRVPKAGTPVIQIDIDVSELGRNYPCVVALSGDAKATLRRLIKSIDQQAKKANWASHAMEIVNEWREATEPFRNSDASPIHPERLCKELTDALPSDAVLVADTGYSSVWTGTMVDLTHRGQSYIRAAGTLGWAFPASLGVKCAVKKRPVVCFTGDGGFWYHISELETAARCGINTVTVVNNNRCFSQSSVGIKIAYGDRPGNSGDLYVHRGVNFARIAEEMGCLGIRVELPGQIAEALNEAFLAEKPVVIDVVTDENCKPAWAPNYYDENNT